MECKHHIHAENTPSNLAFFPLNPKKSMIPFRKAHMKREYDLEKRLTTYSCKMINIVEQLPSTKAGKYIAGQLIRSGNSPAFNYGEAQSAESRRDFVHKLKVVLKELKECRIALTIIKEKNMLDDANILNEQLKETEELIAIIAKSIDTAEKNIEKGLD